MGTQLAREGDLALLKGGVERWNVFRREHTEYVVLNHASLTEAHLANADLHCVLLVESDLRRGDLTCAILERAILRKADFRDSDLDAPSWTAPTCAVPFSREPICAAPVSLQPFSNARI